MNEEEKRYNEIDMECNVGLDDDDGFGSFETSKTTNKVVFDSPNFDQVKDEEPAPTIQAADDNREIDSSTGIILDFGDDEEVKIDPTDIEVVDHEPIIAQSPEDLFNNKLNSEEVNMPKEFTGFNEIDMECEVPDDYEEEAKPLSNSGAYLDFGDDDEQDEIDRQLVNEQIVEESKREAKAQIDQGDVENDYYDKLKKKHAASNKKGAYNYHFHFSGNPEAEKDMFNHDMTPQGAVPNMATAANGAVGDTGMTVASQGMGMCENYNKLFEELLYITGCEGKSNNGKYCLSDKYGDFGNKECETIQDIQDFLNPFVIDCFIIPLQVETGNNLNTCKEWSDWYTPEMEKKYPQCKKDIEYCNLCANHLPDCKLF